MFLDDRVGDRQPQTRSLADFFRREKRIEDLRLDLLRNSRAVIVDFENDRLVFGVVPRTGDEDAAAVRGEHRLLGVDDEVQQDLLELVRIGEDERQSRGERFVDGDVVQSLLVRTQRERLAHDLVHVHHRARRVALAGEGQQVVHDARRATRPRS
jgi:hypothetical protein